MNDDGSWFLYSPHYGTLDNGVLRKNRCPAHFISHRFDALFKVKIISSGDIVIDRKKIPRIAKLVI